MGPSLMDGEILLRLPFNFTKAISWELQLAESQGHHLYVP